ncbi:MAG: peptidoglycan-binding protein [Nostocaceae cyanobacterium]|nr:peptidoglycan-binding protein [Nostocaceae cyanobacterium]
MTNLEFKTPDWLNDFDFEASHAISEKESIAALANPLAFQFVGLVQNAPGCSTSVVNGLSQQLIHQMQIMPYNVLVNFDELDIEIGAATFCLLQLPAKLALQQAIQARGQRLKINSAYRTIAQQFLLYKWYQNRTCGIPLAAIPGRSIHQSGCAIDIEDWQGWKPFLEQYGWKWYGPQDKPHFDYTGRGIIDIRSTAIKAFQILWNKNNPNDKILEDGIYGPQTEKRLSNSPSDGFEIAPWDENPRILRLTKPMMQGSDVRRLQAMLKETGYEIDVDGFFGEKTEAIVKQFQEENGLTVDGIVGPNTWAKLKN